jgi:hypothetical protein
VLSDGNLDIRFCGDTQQSLSDRDGLFGRIQPDFENLVRPRQLADEALELPLLLFAFARGRTKFLALRACFVHEGRVDLAHSNHLYPRSWPSSECVSVFGVTGADYTPLFRIRKGFFMVSGS